MTSLKIQGREFGYIQTLISPNVCKYMLIQLDGRMTGPTGDWISLNYEGDDEEEIISELYLHYTECYIYKRSDIPSKDFIKIIQ